MKEKQFDEKYEEIFTNYPYEDPFRKNIINNIRESNYKDLKDNICKKINYELSILDIIRISEAYKIADNKLKKKIQYVLEDCNFHYECGELMDNKADLVIKEQKDYYIEHLKNETINIFEKNLDINRYAFYIRLDSEELKEYTSLELEFLVEQNILKQKGMKNPIFMLEQKYLDKYLEKKWKQLEDIPFKEVDSELILDGNYWDFEKDYVSNEDIWHYFDENHSKGIYYLLYEFEENQTDEETL